MQRLFTPSGAALSGTSWNDYPRPQLVREEWLCLNGPWHFTAGGRETEIRVPFCPESLLSGADMSVPYGQELRYERDFTLPESWRERRVLLHCGAVSRRAEVLVNGKKAAEHDNGYLSFSADITHLLREGENTLTILAVNDLSHQHPWGKQKLRRGGMWYTPVSGVWQTVWLEPVPEEYIRAVRIRTGENWAEIRPEGVRSGVVTLDGTEYPLENGTARISLAEPRLWSPEDPHLYRFRIDAGEDRVESYFALRTLTIRKVRGVPRLCLNGKPYFFNGLLDQGYWSDGLYTPPDPESYQRDILAMKDLGFNMLRKHIKIEPERFYYDCDRLGMAVWQDMVNCGEYSFLRDTVLPTLGLTRLNDRRLQPDPETRRNFLRSMEGTVEQLQNHPCICCWTIFNEGWGQFCADEAYRRLKALDDSRFIDATSGWFVRRESDVESLHVYFRPLRAHPGKRPVVISEFGGYVFKLPEHSFNRDKTYGYRVFPDRDSFVRGLRRLYEKELIPLAEKCVSAAVYTQVSDVEDETNGLLTFDRRVRKIRPEELADLARRLRQAGEKDG